MTNLIECKNLAIGYSSKPLMQNINFAISSNEFVGLLGPNGSGKSTLVKTILGLLPKISGEIQKKPNINISYVPQKLKLNHQIPLSIDDFLKLKEGKVEKAWKLEVLNIVGLNHQLNDSVHILSGGQLQRLFIAFSLLSKPDLIILDEATEGMDINSLKEVFKRLQIYTKENSASLIYITHDISAVNEQCSRVLCLHNKLAYDGSPENPEFHQCLHDIYGEKSFIHDHRH